MRKLFALLLVAATSLAADETAWWTFQSGPPPAIYGAYGPTPLHDRGLHGEGQVIALLDTGVDYWSCYFAEPDGALPPINTGSPTIGYAWENVVPSRRKIIAYDFLYSCDQFPGAKGCDDPASRDAFDNTGHGTRAAGSAVGDQGTPVVHDIADAIATGAKLIVQDAGFIGGDNCSQRPGIGCPANLTPILDQAYRQGARIHSNSWGDRQGVPAALPPPTANYSQSARDVDAFVYSHPDMLVVFNTGNFGSQGQPPASSLSAPGCAKNTLQVGGTRTPGRDNDNWLTLFSLVGPTRDGRIKPDVVGPAWNVAAEATNVFDGSCSALFGYDGGTSWSSPSVAGAAALVRQYFTEGFYPTGVATRANAIVPSAALLKATIIAAARRAQYEQLTAGVDTETAPVPSYQQGFGFPVLDDALYFPGDRSKLRIADVPLAGGLAEGEESTQKVSVTAGTALKVVLVWTDPAGVPRSVSDPTPELVNDLDLRVTTPAGAVLYGNEALHPGQPDRLNNVEAVSLAAPASGTYLVSVSAHHLGGGARQSYALVITGDVADALTGRVRAVRSR